VVNVQNPVEVIARQDKRIDSASTIALLQAVIAANPTKKRIHVYCDSASYYTSKQVTEWVATTPVVLHFLPVYSPNLNPIERLWKFMRSQVIDSVYYATLAQFRSSLLAFLGHLEPYRPQLERLLTLKFTIVQNQHLVAI
jgi:transposase